MTLIKMRTAWNSPYIPLPLPEMKNKQEITKIHNRHQAGISPFITVIIRLSEIQKKHKLYSKRCQAARLQRLPHSETNLDSIPEFAFSPCARLSILQVLCNMHTGFNGWMCVSCDVTCPGCFQAVGISLQ